MYLGLRDKWKTKESNEMRECIIETKSGTTWNTLVELENIISRKILPHNTLERVVNGLQNN